MNGMTFDQFRAAVDARLMTTHGIGIDDLADCNLADWHEEGCSVAQATRKAIAFDQGDDSAD